MVGMEAAAVSVAVSATLKLVCNKLGPLVIKEYSSIVGVEKDLQELQDLALEINQRLEAAGDRAMGDAPSLKKLKEAIYKVDDVVDEFQLKAEKYEADGDGGFVSKYLHTKPKSLIFQCQAAKKIKKIKKMFDVLVKQRTILNSVVGNDPVSHININSTAVSKQTLPFVDGAKVIGRQKEKHQIISTLLEIDDKQRINIVSIVGLGGSGKTTLAQHVFNEIESIKGKHFPVRLWVHVSEEFHVDKIIKKLFDAIPDEKPEGLSLTNMANRISEMLANNRFLLVLDDVWIEDRIKWEQFMVHVKNGSPGNKGSNILLTTRSKKVAKTVDSTSLIDLPSLSKDCSWQVFQQSFGNAVKDLDREFQEVGKQIVDKCGGMPLAIKVLAGILRDKKRVEQWHAIKDNNLLDVDDKERQVSACLWLSYVNLPSHLKQCFTICSIFPKGHYIDKDQLIDLWIAHDMVAEDDVSYMEYVGDDYFSHLVQMYFIQDVEEAEGGRVKCKMHDLVHDLARSILGDEISLAMPKKLTNCTKMCKYFSIMEHTRYLPPKNTFQKARAMYIAKNGDFIFGKALKNAKHLRSITVEYVHTSALTAMLQTKNLRYLNITGLRHKTLPEFISDIWCLQSLHVTSNDLVNLPESIGKLQKLRVLNLSYSWRLTCLPDSIGNCVMISSIDLFGCGQFATLPSSISRNKRLRVLRLGCTRLERLPSSITTLENLEYLDLRRCSELVELPEGIGNLKKLVVMNLKECGKLRAIPKGIAQLTRLETVGLFVMGEDDGAQISELENINKISGELTIQGVAHCMDPDVAHKEWLKQKTNLQSLTIVCANNVGVNSKNQLEGLEPPPGIKKLKTVRYSCQEFMQWMLKHRGAEVAGLPRFRMLSKLELSDFPNLERLEGLVELPCLEKLVLKQMTALESISGGPFPKLLKLVMEELPRLGMVWMATDVKGGQVEIGNRLFLLVICKCPKLMVMPCFPSSLKYLYLTKSNVKLLGLLGQGQGSSLPSNSVGLPSFSFSCLKHLGLSNMPPPARAASYGSGCRWELLQHFTALESLNISNCDGLTKLPESMRSLASLRSLSISRCKDLCMLPEWLGELCYLEKMNIYGCGSLSPAPSMQPLRALKALHISDSGWVWNLCSLSLQTLSILDCDSPQSFRQLTSLTNLKIERCRDFHMLLRELPSLQMLCIVGSQVPKNMSYFTQSFGYLTSLQELQIKHCIELAQLPESVGELHSLRIFKLWSLPSLECLPQSLGRLTSLQELEITACKALDQLPESLGELRSLRKFEICGLSGLTSIPESMCCLTSLEQLAIRSCPGIRSLPEWIKGLIALQTLYISGCPELERRCQRGRGKGKDWHLISHIPHLWIGQKDARFIW